MGAQQNRRAVLIVEDDAELREFAARLLEDGELDTIECESAEAALATMLIRGQDVAMIFADIRLPGVMDGHTAHARFDALLENRIFYISRMYEFLHNQGHKQTRPRT